jgi:hypothetical protein
VSDGSDPPRQPRAASTLSPPLPGTATTLVMCDVRYGEFFGFGSGFSTTCHGALVSDATRRRRPLCVAANAYRPMNRIS